MDSRPVRVMVDSTGDLPAGIAAALNIVIIPTTVTFGSKAFRHGVDLDNAGFYRLLAQEPYMPTTSGPPLDVLSSMYIEQLDSGYDVLSLHIGSGLSSLCETSAGVAAGISADRIAVVDSQNVSMALGLLAMRAARAAAEGQALGQVVDVARSLAPYLHLGGVLESLEYVHKGGRISGTAALLGMLLSIRLVFEVHANATRVVANVRTTGKALARLVEEMRTWGTWEDLAIIHARNQPMADALTERCASAFPAQRIIEAEAGPTVATHAGPGGFGAACLVAPA
jgi:DegV family protein with EDD domain